MRFFSLLMLPSLCLAQINLHGRVITRDSTQRGVKGVTVTLVNRDLTALTDSNGYWSIPQTSTRVLARERASTDHALQRIRLSNGHLFIALGDHDIKGRHIAGTHGQILFGQKVVGARSTAAGVDTVIYTFNQCGTYYGPFLSNDNTNQACSDAWSLNSIKFLTDTLLSVNRQDTLVRSYDITVNPNIIHGYIKDSRDGKQYRTVTVQTPKNKLSSATQTALVWMSDNLDYTIDSSFVLGGSKDNEVKYGRLYPWAQAVGLPDKCNDTTVLYSPCQPVTTGKHVQGVCPVGWHVPNSSEITLLDSSSGCGNTYTEQGCNAIAGGVKLRELVQWKRVSFYGTDTYGFHAVPSGAIDPLRPATNSVDYFYMWTTETMKWSKDYSNARAAFLNGALIGLRDGVNRRTRVSVRCVKDW